MAEAASEFLAAHRWCGQITDARLGFAASGVIGFFQFEHEPTEADVDRHLWVVVGDLPPAYLACGENESWQDALRAYIFEMRRWVSAVRQGESLADVIPVNGAPTEQNAAALESRLDFLERELANVALDTLESDI